MPRPKPIEPYDIFTLSLRRSRKAHFIKACQLNGDVPTYLLRKFVDDYCKRNPLPASEAPTTAPAGDEAEDI